MSKIYTTQTDLLLKIETDKDLTGINDVKIKYIDPDKISGELVGTVLDEPTGIVSYTPPIGNSPFTKAGTWVFWVHVTDGANRVSVGNTFKVNFYNEGV